MPDQAVERPANRNRSADTLLFTLGPGTPYPLWAICKSIHWIDCISLLAFNGKFRAERPNQHWFLTLDDVRRKTEERRGPGQR